MDHLDDLENRSIYIIREAYASWRQSALLWSMGKDSTALLWIMRKAFFGRIPFPVVHIDTSYKFQEIYEFRDKYTRHWGLDLIVSRNEQALSQGMSRQQGTFNCCSALKTDALNMVLDQYGFQALYLAIRRDEHGIRAKERHISPRGEQGQWDYAHQPPELWDLYQRNLAKHKHARIHPLLDWTEMDVWRYIQREKIPIPALYLANKGQRYRSIGCACCCQPMASNAGRLTQIIKEIASSDIAERSGRQQDKEDHMQKLRSLGYM